LTRCTKRGTKLRPCIIKEGQFNEVKIGPNSDQN
jgi:hypothetical protein